MKIQNKNQILGGSGYICIYLHPHFLLPLQIPISNYLMQDLCLNILTMDLLCKKGKDLLFLELWKYHYLLNSVHESLLWEYRMINKT